MIGSILKRKREDKKISQQEVADILGISQKTYSNIESNKSNASLPQLLEMSKLLDFNLLIELAKKGITFNNNNIEGSGIESNTISKELKKQYEDQINHLNEEVDFLRSQLSKTIKNK